MPAKKRNYDRELANIMNAMAEATLEMSDEEVLAEIKEEDDRTDAVRNILRKAVKDYRQKPLLEAQKRYEERVEAMRRKKYDLPESAADRRKLLNALIASNNATSAALLTMQHRDFTNISDEEVDSYLNQLIELGAMDDTTSDGDEGK